MNPINFQTDSPLVRSNSPPKLVHSDINNAQKSELVDRNYSERNISPTKGIVGDRKNDQIFSERKYDGSFVSLEKSMNEKQKSEISEMDYNDRNISPPGVIVEDSKNEKRFIDQNNDEKTIKRHKDDEPKSKVIEMNYNDRIISPPGVIVEDNKNEKRSIDQNNDEKTINSHRDDEPKSKIMDRMYDERKDISTEIQPNDYRLLAPKPDLDNDFSEQLSENPSSVPHELDSLDYRSEFENPSHPEHYRSNQFFINDINKMDQNKYSDNNINLFDLTPDQQLAIRELELRRQQTEFEDDYDYSLNYDQMPDYDVREKLETLNAQLANEPSPPEPEHRNSRVAFKDELVSIAAPVEEYALSESEQEELNDVPIYSRFNPTEVNSEIEYSSPIMSSEENITPLPDVETTHKESLSTVVLEPHVSEREICEPEPEPEFQLTEERTTDSDNKKDIDIVVSRGGKFQLMDQSDMVDSSGNIVNPNEEILDENNDKPKQRPISAPAAKRNRSDVWLNVPISSSNSSVKSEMNYQSKPSDRPNSKYDVPKVDRELLQRQKEKEERRKKEQREREELELKNRREMNENCFNAWLQNKNKSLKEESERRKKEEEEERKQHEKTEEENKAAELEKLKELARTREQQKRREEKLRQYRIKEMEEAMVVHSESECKKAFKDWIKKKKLDHQMKQKEEKQKARITRLAMRQCRKSQNLAQAIHQANTFRYLDFYGYP